MGNSVTGTPCFSASAHSQWSPPVPALAQGRSGVSAPQMCTCESTISMVHRLPPKVRNLLARQLHQVGDVVPLDLSRPARNRCNEYVAHVALHVEALGVAVGAH